MSKKDKLTTRFKAMPSDFTWDELKRLLSALGYQELQKGKTSGSRVKFLHRDCPPIFLHKPHPKPVLKAYQLRIVREMLEAEKLI